MQWRTLFQHTISVESVGNVRDWRSAFALQRKSLTSLVDVSLTSNKLCTIAHLPTSLYMVSSLNGFNASNATLWIVPHIIQLRNCIPSTSGWSVRNISLRRCPGKPVQTWTARISILKFQKQRPPHKIPGGTLDQSSQYTSMVREENHTIAKKSVPANSGSHDCQQLYWTNQVPFAGLGPAVHQMLGNMRSKNPDVPDATAPHKEHSTNATSDAVIEWFARSISEDQCRRAGFGGRNTPWP